MKSIKYFKNVRPYRYGTNMKYKSINYVTVVILAQSQKVLDYVSLIIILLFNYKKNNMEAFCVVTKCCKCCWQHCPHKCLVSDYKAILFLSAKGIDRNYTKDPSLYTQDT